MFSSAMHSMSVPEEWTALECHGNVKEMNVIKQVSDLSMGWCINCHRTKKLDFHNNQFYSQYKDFG